MPRFEVATEIPCESAELYAWHSRPGAFERLAPPWQRIQVVDSPDGGLENGRRVLFRLYRGPFRIPWLAEHRAVQPGRSFEDVQVRGPFRRWTHLHRFDALGPGRARLLDRIEYELPCRRLAEPLFGRSVQSDLSRVFRYRHDTTAADLRAHTRAGEVGTLRIGITGASGLIGTALAAFLTSGGHSVLRLGRRPPAADANWLHWDPENGVSSLAPLEGFDALIHLAGESIASGRWTAAKKTRIRSSRVGLTRTLVESMSKLDRPPKTFVSASAIGIYGDRGDEELTETSTFGQGFLADVGTAWEAAARAADRQGIRTVLARFGVVLTPHGGALAKMLTPFRLGFGGRIGAGNQFFSWISLDDVLVALFHCVTDETVEGPLNVVAPNPVTNREMARTLARVLRRPALAPVPAPMIRLLFGEMGKAALLASTRAIPHRLLGAEFEFRHPTVDLCLRHQLGRW